MRSSLCLSQPPLILGSGAYLPAGTAPCISAASLCFLRLQAADVEALGQAICAARPLA